MCRIIVADPSAFCRELMSVALEARGFEVHCCQPGDAAAIVARIQPSMMILEPADAAGFPLIEQLRTDPRWKDLPLLVLTESASKPAVLKAGGLGIRDYMLKSRFTLAELLTRVRKYAVAVAGPESIAGALTGSDDKPFAPPPATANSPVLSLQTASPEDDQRAVHLAANTIHFTPLTREQMIQRIERAPLKTLPGVVTELLKLVNSPRGTMGDVAHILKGDPILSARLLQLANSAAFASRRMRTSSVDEAVRNIGVSGVRNLVLSVGIFETVGNEAGSAASVLLCWQHSLAVAMLMEQLTRPCDEVPPGSAYIVGLCHDLTDIILRQYFAEEYARMIELAALTGRPQRQVESVVFGIQYNELAGMLLSRLGLPSLVTVPIEEFFERAVRKQPSGAGSLLGRTLRIANVYAHGLLLAPGIDEPVTPLTIAECRNTFGTRGLPVLDDATLRGEAMTTASLLAGHQGRDVSKSCELPLSRSKLRVCYIRDIDYGELDPLLTFLRLTTAAVDVHPRLPRTSSELNGCDAIIIAARRNMTLPEARQAIGRARQIANGLRLLYLGGGDLGALSDANATVLRLPLSLRDAGNFMGVLKLNSPNHPTIRRAAAA